MQLRGPMRVRFVAVTILSCVMVCGIPYIKPLSTPALGQELPRLARVYGSRPETAVLKEQSASAAQNKLLAEQTELVDGTKEKLEKTIQSLEKKASSQASAVILSWMDQEVFWGISWLRLGLTFILLLVVAGCDRLIRFAIRLRIRKEIVAEDGSASWTTIFLQALSQPLSLFIWVCGAYIALALLLLHVKIPWDTGTLLNLGRKGMQIGSAGAVIWFGWRIIESVEIQIARKTKIRDTGINQLLVAIVGKSLRIFVVLIGGMVLVQSATGVELAPLIASLGLGGLAVALAAKDSLANFFGTLTIIFDKPFSAGDNVIINKHEGVVEFVGLRSTRIRTPDGNLVSIPNQAIINSSLENAGVRPHIRWATTVELSHNTPPELVERAVQIISEVLQNHEGMSEDLPPRVFFNGFGEGSLKIAVTAWYHPADWWKYQAWLQEMCLQILSKFGADGIKLAAPVREVYLRETKSGLGSPEDSRGRESDRPKETP